MNERLYVVTETYQHFVHWCYLHKVSPRLRELMPLSSGASCRSLLGQYEPVYTVYSYPRDSQLVFQQLAVCFGKELTEEQADAWIATRREGNGDD